MKILCPTDFSNTSYNAAQWAYEFLIEMGGGELSIVHCLNVRNRSDMFTKLNDILRERATMDLDILKGVLSPGDQSDVKVETYLYDVDPKSFLPTMARQKEADLIVIGSKGLTALKDLTFGSVAETLARKSDVPVMIIPDGISFAKPRSLVLAVDSEEFNRPSLPSRITSLMPESLEDVYVVHVERDCPEVYPEERQTDIMKSLKGVDLQFSCQELKDSIVQTVNRYAAEKEADMVCLVHRPRGWFARLVQPSIAKEAIYYLQGPLLVLRDK